MKKVILLLAAVAAVVVCSCKEVKPKESCERYAMTLTDIVCDDMETSFPGEMYMSGQYFVWTDPFNKDAFVHIVDTKTGKEVGTMVQKGEGPEEFVSPHVDVMTGNRLFAYDLFANRGAVLSIDSCIAGGNPVVRKQPIELKDFTSLVFLDEDLLVAFIPAANEPFVMVEQKQSFGKLPFDGNINNVYDHFQGIVKYNPYNEYLYYSTFKIPYTALYKRDDQGFSLEKEELRTNDYSIENNDLKYTGNVRGPMGVTLTADYIVSIDTDPQAEPIDYFKIGLDYTKLPTTICLYDYSLQLRKVINVGMPVVRITSSPQNNVLFVLGVSPDFTLYRVEL
ncbi:MAG: hypothetical protein LBK45_07435 [Tannerellaceae bacterium]|jgi:hypothetical protein|nr:hypothetical protein [Tannerellaceae bacterium]